MTEFPVYTVYHRLFTVESSCWHSTSLSDQHYHCISQAPSTYFVFDGHNRIYTHREKKKEHEYQQHFLGNDVTWIYVLITGQMCHCTTQQKRMRDLYAIEQWCCDTLCAFHFYLDTNFCDCSIAFHV